MIINISDFSGGSRPNVDRVLSQKSHAKNEIFVHFHSNLEILTRFQKICDPVWTTTGFSAVSSTATFYDRMKTGPMRHSACYVSSSKCGCWQIPGARRLCADEKIITVVNFHIPYTIWDIHSDQFDCLLNWQISNFMKNCYPNFIAMQFTQNYLLLCMGAEQLTWTWYKSQIFRNQNRPYIIPFSFSSFVLPFTGSKASQLSKHSAIFAIFRWELLRDVCIESSQCLTVFTSINQSHFKSWFWT